MNNEPVAECCDDGEGGVYYKTLANKAPIGKLYTHPEKTLTDEEIKEIIHRKYWIGTDVEALIIFAHELLKKANEK